MQRVNASCNVFVIDPRHFEEVTVRREMAPLNTSSTLFNIQVIVALPTSSTICVVLKLLANHSHLQGTAVYRVPLPFTKRETSRVEDHSCRGYRCRSRNHLQRKKRRWQAQSKSLLSCLRKQRPDSRKPGRRESSIRRIASSYRANCQVFLLARETRNVSPHSRLSRSEIRP
jgi:hypothetical protein